MIFELLRSVFLIFKHMETIYFCYCHLIQLHCGKKCICHPFLKLRVTSWPICGNFLINIAHKLQKNGYFLIFRGVELYLSPISQCVFQIFSIFNFFKSPVKLVDLTLFPNLYLRHIRCEFMCSVAGAKELGEDTCFLGVTTTSLEEGQHPAE